MKPLLSILIPTVDGREFQFERLYARITTLSENLPVEILSLKDNKEMTIGEKRERLYTMAEGIFSWQIDDDDDIPDYAIKDIVSVGDLPVSCITFLEEGFINKDHFIANHSLEYEKWADDFDGFDYVRCPFYKDVIRTEIAKSVPFPRIRWNEDEQWSMALRPHLKNEFHFYNFPYYFYQHNSKPEDFLERYGIR